jgi:hypothetical protein
MKLTHRLQLVLAVCALTLAACNTPAPSPVPPPPPAVANVAGVWTLTTTSQIGTQDIKMTAQQTGNEFKGTLESPQGTLPYTGTLNGNDVKFWFTYNGQGMELRIDFIGTIAGDAMQGRAVFGTYGEGTFTAKKQ